ncbi:MAG TPA: hypothetical protein VMQ93_18050 [Novosphingobium sp.]|nr:hypothetical protein [Novosphingobium sp.]
MPEATAPGLTIVPDIAAVPWRPIVAGLHSRSLHVDPATGARTALIRMVPEEGYVAPSVAHYHETYEEIVGLGGRFTFDSRTWLGRASYVLHPSGTVHGFASQVVADSVFLSRVGPGHKAILVPEPTSDTMYTAPGFTPRCEAMALADPLSTLMPVDAPLLGVMARWRGLGASAFVTLPAGWSTPGGQIDVAMQLFVLGGRLDVGGTVVGGAEGGFASAEAGARWPGVTAIDDCLLFVAQGTPEPIA